MYIVGIYIGIGILTSLRIPQTKNLHDEEIDETVVTPWLRVFVGLSWPLYYMLRYINRRK